MAGVAEREDLLSAGEGRNLAARNNELPDMLPAGCGRLRDCDAIRIGDRRVVAKIRDCFAACGGEIVVGLVDETLGVILAHLVGDFLIELGKAVVENGDKTGLDLLFRGGHDRGGGGWGGGVS